MSEKFWKVEIISSYPSAWYAGMVGKKIIVTGLNSHQYQSVDLVGNGLCIPKSDTQVICEVEPVITYINVVPKIKKYLVLYLFNNRYDVSEYYYKSQSDFEEQSNAGAKFILLIEDSMIEEVE